VHQGVQNAFHLDLTSPANARYATAGMDYVYDLAEHMGGIYFIEHNKVSCAESIEIGIALLRASIRNDVTRFFFASSACVYPTHRQKSYGTSMGTISPAIALKEDDAWPALPEEGYGFSKLYMEELCRHYSDTYGLEVRMARYHNIFGSPGSWNDGKEKSPAALCRKVAESNGEIEIWGNGEQVRSYLHVSDCVRGTISLMDSDYQYPMNIGSNRWVSINDLVTMIEKIADKKLNRVYNPKGAQGVEARNADINLAWNVLGWQPEVTLEEGLGELYHWIERQNLRMR
jgi:nucleoside-diphosphate-sugar epimerase